MYRMTPVVSAVLMLSVSPALADVGVEVDCPSSVSVNAPLDIAVHLDNDGAQVDVRTIVSLAGNTDDRLGMAGVFGPFVGKTVVGDNPVTIPAFGSADQTIEVVSRVDSSLAGTVAGVIVVVESDDGSDTDTTVAHCLVEVEGRGNR